MTTVAEINAAAHPNAAAARVSTEQLATCPLDGGSGANISFELPQDQGLGVNAWIDPETGGLVVDVETLTFTRRHRDPHRLRDPDLP